MLLAIDTATRIASIALYNADGVQAERSWHSHENHTVELMGEIVRMMDIAAVPRSKLSSVAVALGPGSFTGLRVGMSVAKGIAFGSHIPLLGIPTLDTVAHSHSLQRKPIWAILSAGRGKYSVAVYQARRGRVERVSDNSLVSVSGLAALAGKSMSARPRQHFLFCGEIDSNLAQSLADALGKAAEITSPAMNLRRAGYMAEVAWRRFVRGDHDDLESLAPFYASYEKAAAPPIVQEQNSGTFT